MENKQVRYCLYAHKDWVKQSYTLSPSLPSPIPYTALPPIMHSGLTNWAKVMKGWLHVPQNRNEYGMFDVIHVNMTTKNIGVIRKIRMHCDRAGIPIPKIVVNPDYAIQMWESYEPFDLFLEDMQKADHIFTVHPSASSTLSALLGRKVWTIPHPTDVDRLRQTFPKGEGSQFGSPVIVVIGHIWDQNYLLTSHVVSRIRAERPDVQTVLVGAIEKQGVWLKNTYDEFYPSMPFPDLMALVSKAAVVIDTAATSSGGRIQVECAALGTPCIGNTKNHMQMTLWEPLAVNIFDAGSLMVAINGVLDGVHSDLAESIIDYSYSYSYEKFMEMLNYEE